MSQNYTPFLPVAQWHGHKEGGMLLLWGYLRGTQTISATIIKPFISILYASG